MGSIPMTGAMDTDYRILLLQAAGFIVAGLFFWACWSFMLS